MAEFKSFAGLRNDVQSERMEAGDLVTADNVNIDASGQLSRRDGRTLALAGDYHSLWAAGDLCLMIGGTTLYRVAPGYTTTALRTGLTAGAKMAYQPINERVYYSNGRETGVIEAGASRSWGLAIPAHQGTATATAGSLEAGTYQWAVTYLRDDGQESGTGLAGRIDLEEGGGIALSNLPVSDDPGATLLKVLYLSECNGSVLYEAATIDADATTHTITDAVGGANPLPTQHLSPPPAGQVLAYYKGYALVGTGSELYPSEPQAYELFDLRRYIDMPGPITLLATVESAASSGFVIALRDETGWISGTSPEDFIYTKLTGYGAIPGTLTYVEGTLFGDGSLEGVMLPMWTSTAGVCVAFPDGRIINLTEQRYAMDEDGEGCAVFMPDESRYVVVINH